MKVYSDLQVDAMMNLRFGSLLTKDPKTCFLSYASLGKLFKCSGNKVRNLILARLEKMKKKDLPLLGQLNQATERAQRQRWGMRFLRPHHIDWLTSAAS